jgi:hypothetical protein
VTSQHPGVAKITSLGAGASDHRNSIREADRAVEQLIVG